MWRNITASIVTGASKWGTMLAVGLLGAALWQLGNRAVIEWNEWQAVHAWVLQQAQAQQQAIARQQQAPQQAQQGPMSSAKP